MNEIPKTCANIGDLNQVWTNIIVNACDAMKNQGALKISTEADEENIIVRISDSGPGIPEHIIPKIFEPNFTTKNQGAEFGLGLGLAISSEIIGHAGGRIDVKNKTEGGAEFLILIPIRDDC
ncbi:MAG: ATP-binding protein [Gracilimonas sp.]|nr:ATP-binding protein [Gracilimonas sp.]